MTLVLTTTRQLSPPTIFLSHDWPQGIEHHGDLRGLLRRKPYFRDDVNRGVLGSPPLMGLLQTLRPRWWFAAHLHCRFEAEVVHEGGPAAGAPPQAAQSAERTNPDEIAIDDEDEESGDEGAAPAGTEEKANTADVQKNPDEITLDDEEEEVEAPPPPPPAPVVTSFLALDKCLPRRQFLEVGVTCI